jgi:hypothetical protein
LAGEVGFNGHDKKVLSLVISSKVEEDRVSKFMSGSRAAQGKPRLSVKKAVFCMQKA